MMPSTSISLEDHVPIVAPRFSRRTREGRAHLAIMRRRQELTLLPVGESFLASQLTDALSGEGILHADQLHCQRVNKVESGQLAIVNTPYGLMLRRYFVEENYVRLEAANPEFPALCLAAQQVHIIGRPYKLIRNLESEGRAAA